MARKPQPSPAPRAKPTPRRRKSGDAPSTPPSPEPASINWITALSGITDSALRMAGISRESAVRGFARSPEQLRVMAIAGESLRDVRQVAGLTVAEIASALDLRDKSVWEAVENGREVLSVELILRLASLLARNDPLPFVLRMMRSYQPRLWAVLHELGIDGLPLQLERERDFINIFRRHDAARALDDAQWARLLAFTRQAFELGLGMMAEETTASASIAPRSPARQTSARRGARKPK